MGIMTGDLTLPQIKEALLERIRILRRHLNIADYATVDYANDEILDKLSEGALSDPCLVTNPKILSKKEVIRIYGQILRQKG